jgi:type VI secretion system protein ImpJ
MLAMGRIAVDEARGVFEDGTPFSIPDEADHPVPLEVPENARNQIVFLALSAQLPGAVEAEPNDAPQGAARFAIGEQELADTVSSVRTPVAIDVGRLRLRLVMEEANRSGLHCIGVARITERRVDKQVILDDAYIPPVLDASAARNLLVFVAEIQGLLRHRAAALAARVVDSGGRGVADIADFMVLQAVNRYEPLISHYLTVQNLHPEALYSTLVQLAGELSSFHAQDRKLAPLAPYNHEDLAATYGQVMRQIRRHLSAVLEQTAIAIPLEERKYGVHVALVADKTLVQTAAFVLSVRASLDEASIRRDFPRTSKVGTVENIAQLVNSQLKGIDVASLAVAPRQIPYHPKCAYFQLDKGSPFWKAMQTSGGLAIHVGGDFPDLVMELWAIRGG